MSSTVWVPDWEIKCCGEPFAVGDTVEWDVETRTDDGGWLTEVLGRAMAQATPMRYYARHTGIADEPLRGLVRAIEAVWASSAPSKTDPRVHSTVAGSGRTEPRNAVTDGWEPEDEAGDFIGYVIELG